MKKAGIMVLHPSMGVLRFFEIVADSKMIGINPRVCITCVKNLFWRFSQFGTANEFNSYGKLDLVVGDRSEIERNASYESR